MDPFSVTCETCQTRLTVRDSAIVGEIHGCPKCGSMVLIAPPSLTTEPSAAPTIQPTSSALSTEPNAFDAIDDTLSNLSAMPAEEPVTEPSGAQAAEPETTPEPTSPSPTEAPTAATATAGWTVPQIIWTTAGALSIAMVATLGVLWAIQPDKRSAERQVETPSVDDDLSGRPNSSVTTTPPSDGPGGNSVEVNKPVVPDPNAPATDDEAKPAETEVTETPLVEPPALPPLPEVPPLPEAEGPVTQVVPTESVEQVPRVLDPLGIDPANIDLLLAPRVAVAIPIEPAIETREPIVVADTPPAAGPIPNSRFSPGEFVRGPTALESPSDKPAQERLAMAIPEFQVERAPLHGTLSQLGHLGSLACTIDPFTLDMAATTANRPLTYSTSNTTLGELLGTIATGLRLEIQTDGSVVRLQKPGAGKVRSVDYDVADLVGDEAGCETLAQLIRNCVDANWQANRLICSGSKIHIEQPLATQYRVLILLERLRLARGQVTKSKYPSQLLTAEPRYGQMKAATSRTVTCTFVDYASLRTAVMHLEQSSGFAIAIDWPALAEQKLSPHSLVAGSVFEVPLAETLDRFCEPIDCTWQPIDAKTIWITTDRRANDYAWTEFYPASQSFSNANDVVDWLAERLPNEALSKATIVDDDAGKHIVVHASQAIHRKVADMPSD